MFVVVGSSSARLYQHFLRPTAQIVNRRRARARAGKQKKKKKKRKRKNNEKGKKKKKKEKKKNGDKKEGTNATPQQAHSLCTNYADPRNTRSATSTSKESGSKCAWGLHKRAGCYATPTHKPFVILSLLVCLPNLHVCLSARFVRCCPLLSVLDFRVRVRARVRASLQRVSSESPASEIERDLKSDRERASRDERGKSRRRRRDERERERRRRDEQASEREREREWSLCVRRRLWACGRSDGLATVPPC